MPRRGGEAAQRGFLYQSLWTVNAALDVIDGEFSDLIVEPLGEDGLGIDFILTESSGLRRFHSVKRRHSEGNWTISRLSQKDRTDRSVLGDLMDRTRNGGIGVFCSGTSASDLEAVTDHARASHVWKDFEQRIRENQRIASVLQERIVQSCGGEATTLEALRRLCVRTKNESELVTEIDRRIRTMFRSENHESLDPVQVRLLLADFLTRNLGRSIDAESIRGDTQFARISAIPVHRRCESSTAHARR